MPHGSRGQRRACFLVVCAPPAPRIRFLVVCAPPRGAGTPFPVWQTKAPHHAVVSAARHARSKRECGAIYVYFKRRTRHFSIGATRAPSHGGAPRLPPPPPPPPPRTGCPAGGREGPGTHGAGRERRGADPGDAHCGQRAPRPSPQRPSARPEGPGLPACGLGRSPLPPGLGRPHSGSAGAGWTRGRVS